MRRLPESRAVHEDDVGESRAIHEEDVGESRAIREADVGLAHAKINAERAGTRSTRMLAVRRTA